MKKLTKYRFLWLLLFGAIPQAKGSFFGDNRVLVVKKGTKAAQTATTAARRAVETAKLPVGRRGAPLKEFIKGRTRNIAKVIKGRKFTGHALDQMQNRGITSPTLVLDIIKNPIRSLPGNMPHTTMFIGEKLKVVVNKAGDIITIIPK